MEKQIRNARKRVPPPNAVKRKNMSPLPESTSVSRKTLRQLPHGAQKIEQGKKALKTIEVINGVVTFFLVIPCEQGEPDKVTPLYFVKENEYGGAESGVWQCRECTRIFETRRSWEKHKGIKWIKQSGAWICV